MNRDFKGIWIPKQVYLDKSLKWTEKILLIEIDSLDNEKGCFASNEYFAEFLGITVTQISRCISKLKKKGLVYQESFNGRERILKSSIVARQTLLKGQGSTDVDVKHNNTVNNKKNIQSSQEIQDKVEKVINHLNKQTNKAFRVVEANAKFIRARLNEGYKFGDLIHVIDVKSQQWLNTEQNMYLRPATLFNATKFQGYVQEKQVKYIKPKTEVEQAASNL